MAYKDGEVFTTYCDKPYGQNKYKLVLHSGKAIIYEDYELMRAWWWQWKANCSHVEIITKNQVGKGF